MTILLNLSFVLCAILHAAEEKVSGYVKNVIDGDTVYVYTIDRKLIKVRLAFIDAPEITQPFGTNAKQFLKKLEGEYVTCAIKDKDRYGRMVAVLFHKGKDINLTMLHNGYAWVYKRYLKYASETMKINYVGAENLARENQLGLWKIDGYVAPWKWRKQNKKGVKKI